MTCLAPYHRYLMRAANTTLKFGSPSVGVMDDTTFREILNAVAEESVANPDRVDFFNATRDITANMYSRAEGFGAALYPYGSEFAFDTTGQEAVVVWLLHFSNNTNSFEKDAKRTVDHILSYMRSSGTWAYNGGHLDLHSAPNVFIVHGAKCIDPVSHVTCTRSGAAGGSRSWGDLGNNGKWQATAGTGYETRGNFHYRSGLNAIPLLEWYRRHPDDVFLLEPALGAVAGQ